MKQKKSEVKEMPAAVTQVDIDKLENETKELDKEWGLLNGSKNYQKKETETPKEESKPNESKKYLLRTIGAATFFLVGAFAGVGVKSYESDLLQCGNNAWTRVTNVAYAIIGKTPECKIQEIQKKGLTERIECLETSLSTDEFASLQKDLEIVLEKYYNANKHTIKYEGGN